MAKTSKFILDYFSSRQIEHMLSTLIAKLQDEFQTHNDGYVGRVDELLQQVRALNDPDSIRQLLSLLDDEAEYDELMFSIIHVIEAFDDATYVREIVRNLRSLLTRSPRWAVIIHMRILNSSSCMKAFAEQIGNVSANERRLIRDILERVRESNIKLRSSCSALLAMLQ